MDSPIKFGTVKSGWSIIYIEGSRVMLSKYIIFLSLKIDFDLANSVDPGEIAHYAAFHLDIHCLQSTRLGFSSLHMVNSVFVTFPCDDLGQVWYLIVLIPDLCLRTYFK